MRRIHRPTAAAGGVLALTTLIHLFGGGRDVVDPLMAQISGPELRLYVLVIWHFVTAFLALSAIALFWAARDIAARGPVRGLVAALSLAAAGLFAGYGIALLGTLWVAPQWLIFGLVSALTLWPARPRPAPARGAP